MSVRELEEAPSLTPLYARAVARGALPGSGDADGNDLPDLELVLRDVAVDRERLADYDRVCGYRLSDVVPPTYPHIQAFPVAMELMADKRFPFPLLGLVHVANEIVQHRPILVSETPTYKVGVRDLRPHPKGRQFDVEATAEVNGRVVWEGVSTYLQRGGGDGDGGDAGSRDTPQREPSFTAKWRINAATGRRYAGVSGDPNPIHLHPLTARMFGYPRPIAHGMWTKARALAALEGRLPDAFRVAVDFKKPLLLPASVRFASEEFDGTWRFSVTPKDGGTAHLTGDLTSH